jgi:hypothetical protein
VSKSQRESVRDRIGIWNRDAGAVVGDFRYIAFYSGFFGIKINRPAKGDWSPPSHSRLRSSCHLQPLARAFLFAGYRSDGLCLAILRSAL